MFNVLVLALIGLTASAPFEVSLSGFQSWATLHQKKYESETVQTLRTMVWLDNVEYINQLNAESDGSVTYGVNKFTDLTHEEFKELMLAPITQDQTEMLRSQGSTHIPLPENIAVAESVDWREKGAVTAVKNQGHCGSCYSFSTTGSLEGQWFRKTGQLISLSEQQIMDCSWNYGNNGCNGGMFDRAFSYIIAQQGLDTEASYPYAMAESHECKFKADKVGATVVGYAYTESENEDSLKDAVGTKGPVAIAINAGQRSFQHYSFGIYDDPECDSSLNHGVLAVGYGTHQSIPGYHGKEYWWVKNSWGKEWGDDGYIKMRRNKNNQCGISSYASYPLV